MHRSFCEARTFLFFTFFQFSRNSHFHAFGFCQTFSFGRRVRFLFFEPFVICWFLSFGQFSKFQHFEISWISVCSIIRDFSDLAFTWIWALWLVGECCLWVVSRISVFCGNACLGVFSILPSTALATFLYQAPLPVPELPDRKCKQIRSPCDRIELIRFRRVPKRHAALVFCWIRCFSPDGPSGSVFRRTQWVRLRRSLSWQPQNKRQIIHTDPVGPWSPNHCADLSDRTTHLKFQVFYRGGCSML